MDKNFRGKWGKKKPFSLNGIMVEYFLSKKRIRRGKKFNGYPLVWHSFKNFYDGTQHTHISTSLTLFLPSPSP